MINLNQIGQGLSNLGIRKKNLLHWLLPLALVAYVYYPTFVWMIDRWSARDSYYAHGFLIPIVALFWIYKKHKELASVPVQSNVLGLFVILLAAAIQIASVFLRFYFLSGFSFVLLILGAVYFYFGTRVFLKIWFPLAFLFLMIPLPLLIIAQVTIKMKFFVSEVATYLINEIGVPAMREGSYVYTPNSVLLVGDPCSGLRSLLAFVCLGFVFAYDGVLALWQRALIVFVGLPLAIGSNILRVVFLGLVGELYGMEYTGPGSAPHDVSGIVVFVLAFIIFMVMKHKLEQMHAKNK